MHTLIDFNKTESLVAARQTSKKVYEEYIKSHCPLQPIINEMRSYRKNKE